MSPLCITLLGAMLAGLLMAAPALAQRYSVKEDLLEADWHEEAIADGVVWKRVHLDGLFGLPQSLNVLDVDLDAEGVTVDIVSSDTGRVKTSTLARAAGAVAAVNGSFFDTSNGATVVFFQNNGQVVQSASDPLTGERQEAAVAAEQDGDAAVIREPGPTWVRTPHFSDVLASGPLLLWQGQLADTVADDFNVTHHPRTALGLTPENHLLLVTVDGRTSKAAGMTIRELAWVMRGLGCTMALNLDGGGSTTMWIKGKGVVNYPSDNGAYDHEGERTVANTVIVRVGH